MRRLISVLLWSVIAAAFIGPGTVTTAAAAGARYGTALLWALTFATIACLVLQEAAARITVVSGRDLGEALRQQYHGGVVGVAVLLLVLGAIVLGCAAYEVGNVVGAAAGAALGFDVPTWGTTLACAGAAVLLLGLGAAPTVARLLGLLVALMGVAFLLTAWRLAPTAADLARGALWPARPPGSGLLVLGLVGTTVVPYNLFLGSGLARGQRLGELRFGLSVAVVLGGAISMAIVVVGAASPAPFEFASLAAALEREAGAWARALFAAGLFAAGLSSAITAPLAAAITARSLFSGGSDWSERSPRYRAVWLAVLATGVAFSLGGVRPVPAIVLAQALNGLLLPIVAIFLFVAVNDRTLMGAAINGRLANVLTGFVVAMTLLLGATNVGRALAAATGLPQPSERTLLVASAGMLLLVARPVVRRLRARRAGTGRG